MRATKVMGAEPGSVPVFQLYGTSTKADVYKIQVTTAGPSGTAKITITSQEDDGIAAAVVTHGSPFVLGTSGVSAVMFFDYLRINDTWDIRTRSTGEFEEPSPIYDNFPGTVRPSQVGEGLAIQGANKPAIAVIANGAAPSNVIDGRGYNTLIVDMSAAWTAAELVLYTSEKRDGTYSILNDKFGNAISLSVAAAKNFRGLDVLAGVSFFKLVSYDTATPAEVNQGAERILILTIEP